MLTTQPHQSSAMGIAINVLAVFLACLAVGSAVPAHFPHGKTVVYKYYGDAKAGIIEPAPYASQFALEGDLHVKHDTSDPTLKNAYYVALLNVKTGMHNGVAAHYQRTKVLKPIVEAAKVIEKPFLIVYGDDGKLKGVKIPKNEAGWSKNMKMAMASMLQLDLPSMKVNEPTKPRSFISKENTIHGDCWITYDVHAKDQTRPDDNEIVVTKFSSPKNCSGFAVHLFDHVDNEGCQAKIESPVNVASRRLFDIEKQGEDILIKKLVAHGGSNYFPWNQRSEAHYVLTNSTFALQKVVPVAEISLPPMDFLDVPMTLDLTYQKPQGRYAADAAVDVTQGRHVVDQGTTVTKLRKMLSEAADYLDENHLEPKKPDWKHGQTINRILHTMSYMDVGSLEQVFGTYENPNTPKDTTIKNVFLGMIPQVGTSASCLFTLNAIRQRKIADIVAIEMLAKLPMNVKAPSEELVMQMEDLAKFGDSISAEVRKASTLCFGSLVYRTFKNVPNPQDSELLQKYLRHFFGLIKSEQDYDMKMVNLMALKNIQVGKIHEILAPIVRGDLSISEKPVNFRLMAIWAISKSLESDYHYAHDLLWPVMADKSLPVKLRIAAYEILMHQAPSMTDVLHMYWFMVYESNEHLYGYHHTTIKGIANSVDPCRLHLRELVRKIMRFTKVHETIRYTLSSAYSIDYKDEMYNHAERFDAGMIVNEVTGEPEVLKFEHIVTDGRKPVSLIGVRLHIQGPHGMMSLVKDAVALSQGGLSNTNVLDVLRKAAKDMPAPKDLLVDVVLTHKGRVVLANHYNERSWRKLCEDVMHHASTIVKTGPTPSAKHGSRNAQHIVYDNLYEKQVTSDMGLPVVLETRIPIVTSLRSSYDTSPEGTSLEFDARIWRHGDYSMSIYNPMADVWHAIRRSTATDITIPIRASVSYNEETKNARISFPIRQATGPSVAGVLTHAKDCVTVNEDDVEALQRSCPTCSHHEDVSLGEPAKKSYQQSVDSKDTGLRYSMGIFDCENGVTPVTLSGEWFRAFASKRKNDWNNWIAHAVMAVRQQVKNMIISPQMGSCGVLVKNEPSTVYPTSRVELSMRRSYEDLDHIDRSFDVFASQKYNVRGTVDVIGEPTNASVRSWDLNVNVDLNQGHLMNNAKIHLTRKTPGETNLKICVEAQKSYTRPPTDPLKLGVTKEETNSKVTIAVGHTNEDTCVGDDTLATVKMTVKGSLSREQKKQFTRELANGACSGDMKNPLYANPRNIVPKTLNCLDEVIRHTTLRNYTINVTHKEVPQNITSKIHYLEDVLRSQLLPNLKYTIDSTATGNIKMNVEYPVENEDVEVSVATPSRSYDLIDVDFEKPRFNGFGPVVKPVWHLPLDNTRFGIGALKRYAQDDTKMCSVYPKIVLTGDGKNVPFNMNEEWTLISGDHARETFAVFGKMIGDNMAVKVYAKNHQVEIVPSADNNVQLTVDGQPVDQQEGGVLVPNSTKTWILKVTRNSDHILVQMRVAPLLIVHGVNHVALAIDTQLQGRVSGLCGHLDGTYLTRIPRVYATPNL